VILYFHGGGYVAGSVETHREFLAHIARATKRRILAVDYRLAPENPFPAALEDAVTVYRWLLADHRMSPENIAIGGDSAGGGLTLATLLKLKEDGDALPGAAVCLSPWTDLAMTGASITEKDSVDPFINASGMAAIAPAYIGADNAKNPLISPLYGDLSGLPPLLIHVGDRECLLDDSVRFAEKAQAAGSPVTLKVWEELFHVFHLFAGVAPEGREGIQEVAAFLETG
jgi:epsilon-lactone hydrolase